jgi:hypothetical protein
MSGRSNLSVVQEVQVRILFQWCLFFSALPTLLYPILTVEGGARRHSLDRLSWEYDKTNKTVEGGVLVRSLRGFLWMVDMLTSSDAWVEGNGKFATWRHRADGSGETGKKYTAII